MHVSLIEKGKAKCPDFLASRLGLPFRSVVKMELGSRIRQCPQQNFNVTSAGSISTSKIKLTEQCRMAGRFVMSAMFLIESYGLPSMQLTYLLDGRNLSPCGSILKKRDFSTSLIT